MMLKKVMGKVMKSDAEWKKQLSEEQYRVCRQKGTEPAFSGKNNPGQNRKEKGPRNFFFGWFGNSPLTSDAKFDSGTGWPSYFEPVTPHSVVELRDASLSMVRTEVLCSKCDAHLGHVFDDGPLPTGRRYCINSVCLNLNRPVGP